MPQARRELETLAETDSAPAPGSHKASVLALLARDPSVGYEPKEIAAETPVPNASVYKVLQRLREDGLIEKLSGHYLVNDDRVNEIEDALLTTRQLDVAESITDRDTAPDEIDAPTPEEIDTPDDDLLSE